MAIRAFDLGSERGLSRAQAANLGNLVVIAGPNGAGKSTLLDLLKSNRHSLQEPGTTVMFVGPHRTWRSSQLNKVAVYDYQLDSYGAALEAESLPSYRYQMPPGMQGLQGLPRQSSSADDVQAFVKTSLIRLRDRRQALISEAYSAQGGQIAPDTVPDIFAPFEELVALLLPHLEWVGVADENPENIQALFRPRGSASSQFDIDELSSGEKSAIALFLPIVERQAQQLISPRPPESGLVPLTMILDEPEIHLHPLLQIQMLEYMRKLANEKSAQFILTTHSPTLLDALQDNELFLLSPAQISLDNQLTQLTTSEERLEVARQITGSTHLLTRSKPILFVEGESERSGVSTDGRVISMLFPQTQSWAIVPARAKRSVIDSVEKLRQDGLELPGVPVFGLVDADRDVKELPDHIFSWPVTMIENLLLDPDAIFSALAPFGTQTAACDIETVRGAIERVVARRTDDEIRMRIKQKLPIGRLEADPLEISGTSEYVKAQVAQWVARIDSIAESDVELDARSEVAQIEADGQQAERFHGKRILHGVYDELRVSGAGIGKPAFALLVANQDGARTRAERLGSKALNTIRFYFPRDLPTLIREVDASDLASEVADRCDEALRTWMAGEAEGVGREALREAVFAIARPLSGRHRQNLVRLATEIGTA